MRQNTLDHQYLISRARLTRAERLTCLVAVGPAPLPPAAAPFPGGVFPAGLGGMMHVSFLMCAASYSLLAVYPAPG